MTQWFAIRAGTRREAAAHDGLAEQGFAVFLPCETLSRRIARELGVVSRPRFPGYLFVLCDPEDFHRITDTEGVHQFVRYMVDDVPTPMPIPLPAIIEIQAAERAGLYDYTKAQKIAYRPKKGDKVRVTAGPWQSFIAKVLNTPRKDRANVMIEGPFGRGVTLDVSHLSAA